MYIQQDLFSQSQSTKSWADWGVTDSYTDDELKAEIKRGDAWAMIRPLSMIHSQIASPFKRSARIVHGRAYQGADDI